MKKEETQAGILSRTKSIELSRSGRKTRASSSGSVKSVRLSYRKRPEEGPQREGNIRRRDHPKGEIIKTPGNFGNVTKQERGKEGNFENASGKMVRR